MTLAGLVDVIHWLEGVFDRLRLDLEGKKISIHAPEDLIVFKKIFDRPKDIGDIKAILMAQKGKLDLDRMKADAKELLTDDGCRELESLVTQFG